MALSLSGDDINMSFLRLDQVFIENSVFLKICMKFEKKILTGCVKYCNQVCVELF